MESHKKLAAVLAAVLALAAVAEGQFSVCKMSTDGLKACQPAASRANPTEPTAACCKALASADLPCFCDLMKSFSNNNAYGVSIERAKQIPALCNLSTPTNCS